MRAAGLLQFSSNLLHPQKQAGYMGYSAVQRLLLWITVENVVQRLGELDELSLVDPWQVLNGLFFLEYFILPLFQIRLQVHFPSTSFGAFSNNTILWKFKGWWEMQLEQKLQLVCKRTTVQSIKGTAELLKVDEAVLVLINEAEDPERQSAFDRAKGPWLQQEKERAELLEAQLILFQIGQARVMM